MIKKRYLYASLLSGIFFIILYVILNFPLWLSLLLTVISYIGGILFFKEKDVRVYDPNLIMHYCYLISKIDYFKTYTKDEKIIGNINDIKEESEKIISMLEQKPNKVTQVYDGFDYYLPLIIKVLEHYFHLEKKESLTPKETKFQEEINLVLNGIEKEIKKLMENMNYTKMLDIDSSIRQFEKDNSLKETLEHGGEES